MKTSIIFGTNAIYAALKSGQTLEKVFLSSVGNKSRYQQVLKIAKQKRIPIQFVPPQALTKKTDGANHQGVVAVVNDVSLLSLEQLLEKCKRSNEPPILVMLDGIEDPHNLGAIIRSAESAGFTGMIIQQRHSAPLSPVVSKVSSGAVYYLPIAKVVNLSKTIDQLQEKGFWLIGSDGQAHKKYWDIDVDMPLVIVVGSEGKGMRRRIKEKCDYLVQIPMFGKTESLNASVAAALLFYEIRKKRLAKN